MNASYKSVWNDALGAWVAVCELARGRCKSSRRLSGAAAARRALVLAGGMAAAIHLVPVASAADYTLNNEADLLQSATTGSTDLGDYTTFILGADVSTAAGRVLSVSTLPINLILNTANHTLNLNGAGTVWDGGTYNYIELNGTAGIGGLSITNGAVMRATAFMNFQAGDLRITGNGSSLTLQGIPPAAGDFTVGRSGDAGVFVTSGGTLTTQRTYLGEDAANTLATTITAVVDGPGSVWTADLAFVAGGGANSVDVTVSNGGMIEIPHATGLDSAVGRNGTASLLVTGPGSRLVVGGSFPAFAIGANQVASGHGTLIIRDGGRVTVPYLVMGYDDSATTGVLTIDSGGVLETVSLWRDQGGATVTVDNGTVRALADNPPGQSLIALFAPGDFTLGAGGMFVDSNGFDVTVGSNISGVGGITKQGAGSVTLLTGSTYGGDTAVVQGTWRAGVANAFSAASAHTVAAGATLDTAGFDQTVARLDNTGTVTLLGSAPGSTLTVNGNYVGHNGLLKLGTALGDSSSISDRLVINGPGVSASGTTTVQITNLGGLGARTTGNGIEIIGARNGATTTAQSTKDAFSLAGGHVDAGAFEYRLFAADANGAGENWYLRTDAPLTDPTAPASPDAPVIPVPAYRPEVPQFAALPEQLRMGNFVMLSNLHQRVGDDRGKGAERQAWGRVISIDRTVSQTGTVSPRSEGRLSGFQAGTDLWADPAWHAGVYVGQLDGDMDVHGFASGIADLAVGSNDLRSQYLGAYATYRNPNGFYVDTVLQGGRHRYDVSPWTSPASHGKGDSLLASVEVGKGFGVAAGWVLEPQLQLMHQRIDLDDASITGADVRQDSHDGWIVRAGLRIKGEMSTAAGPLQPYGRVNVYRSSKGTDITRFVGSGGFTDIETGTGGTSTELAAGATLALSASTSLYGEVGKLWASSGDARQKSELNGSIGIKVRW